MKKLFIFIVIIAALFLFVNHAADYVIFRPLKDVAPMPKGFKEVVIPTTDGTQLHAAYKPAADGKDTIFFFHGKIMLHHL